jgi:hypothetical protein
MADTDVIQGTLDMLILKSLSLQLYIECEDLACEWKPGEYGPEAPDLALDVPNRL